MKNKRKYVYYADLWVSFSVDGPCKPMGTVVVGTRTERPSLEEAINFLRDSKHGYSACHYTQNRTLVMLVKDDKSEFWYLSNIRRGEKVKE